MTGYTCKTTKPPEEVRDLAEKELSGWEFDQTLLFHRNENYSTQEYPISYALAIDAEKLYPDQEISVIGWDNLDWAVCQAKEQNLYPPYCKSHLSNGRWVYGIWRYRWIRNEKLWG